ncbi:ABC transporter permease [Paenibacillus tarimensis]|uniref:ABC transporter permease n=1 Tax=Paenibacillus tarimensis TaxID=416012 RepID=UPI001F177543|nr:ABC transporter permease [Paenibacillus tarimensis]MCF2942172.1 ABC transporter permease [Paenibacillus tarimensis]
MNVLTIAWGVVRRTAGTRKGLITLVLIPVAVIAAIVSLFGHASSEQAVILVQNEDNGYAGEALLSAIADQPLYRIEHAEHKTAGQLQEAVSAGEADAALYIPAQYTARLLEGQSIQVQVYRKSEQLWNAALVLDLEAEAERLAGMAAVATAAGGEEAVQAFQAVQQLRHAASIDVEERVVVTAADNGFVLVIGMMVLFMMILASQAVSGIVDDRNNRTMMRMFAAPVRSLEIAVGNFLGCLVLGTLQLAAIILLARYVLQYDFGVPPLTLFVVLECFLITAVSLTTAIAGLVRSTAQLGHMNNLIVIPTCMIGGCFWPVGFMPPFMQKLSYFTPQRWAIKAVEDLSAGVQFGGIGINLGILLLAAAFMLAVGASILQPAQKASAH